MVFSGTQAVFRSKLSPQCLREGWDNPWESSIINFARALGAVRSNDLATAKNELEILKANEQKLVEKKDSYKAGQVNIQVKATEAWIHYAEGKTDKALALMTEAADQEDATSKHPVTPGEVLPARELLGDMYLLLGKHEQALEHYKLSLEKHQNRFNSLYGAGLAAEKAGKLDDAEKYFMQLISITPNATGTRAELDYAKQFIEKRQGKQLSLR